MTDPTTRVLDYVPRLDPRNNAYRIAMEATSPARWDLSVWWAPGVTLDQGQEGSCVGHGVVGEYLASPVRGKFVRENRPGPYYAEVGHEEAVKVYNRAKQIDEWEGVNYDGTSVRAGLLVSREHGWCTGFRWAKTMNEVRQGLDEGPVVIGVDWHEQMYSTTRDGMVHIGGRFVGGHCLILTGYSKKYGAQGPVFRWQNSWGPSYGINGVGYIKPSDLQMIMFDAGGEAGIVTGRKL